MITYLITSLSLFYSGDNSLALIHIPLLHSGADIYCMVSNGNNNYTKVTSATKHCLVNCKGVWDCSRKICELSDYHNTSTMLVMDYTRDNYTCRNLENQNWWKSSELYQKLECWEITSGVCSFFIMVLSFYTSSHLTKKTSKIKRIILVILWISVRIPFFILINIVHNLIGDEEIDLPPIKNNAEIIFFISLVVLDALYQMWEILTRYESQATPAAPHDLSPQPSPVPQPPAPAGTQAGTQTKDKMKAGTQAGTQTKDKMKAGTQTKDKKKDNSIIEDS